MIKEKFKLNSYSYPSHVTEMVQPLIEFLKKEDFSSFYRNLAIFTLDIINKIQQNKIELTNANNVFTLLDVYIGDNFPDKKLDDDAEKIIFEGMLLHDFGKEHGANIAQMKQLAEELRDGN